MSPVHVYTVNVQFGDCDPAQIVWFPNFFRWMDSASRHYFVQRGVPPWRELVKTCFFIVTAMMEIYTKFFKYVNYGESMQIYTSVTEWREKVLVHRHQVRRGDTLMLEGVGGGFTWGAVLLDY